MFSRRSICRSRRNFINLKLEVLLLEKYKIELSKQAKNDYKDIIHYIKYVLLEPNAAERYAKLMK